MDTLNLFNEPNPAGASAPAAPMVPDAPDEALAARLAASMSAVCAPPLAGAADALNRLPEILRRPVSKLLETEHLERIAEISRRAARADSDSQAHYSPLVLAQSVAQSVKSTADRFALLPWHIADAAQIERIAADVEAGADLPEIERQLEALKPIHLFVAALPEDDRDSYLKAVAAAIKGRRIARVVLDAEIIEWSPQAEFDIACAAIGLRGFFVGISTRASAERHSDINPETRRKGVEAVMIDTLGRPFRPHQPVEEPASGGRRATQLRGPQASSAQPAAAEKKDESAPVGMPAPAGGHMQGRIQAMREAQAARRRAARP